MEKCYNAPQKLRNSKRVVFISDIHELHPRVDTAHISDNMWDMLTPYFDTMDALYITGDFWDGSKYLRQNDVHIAASFISRLVGAAKKHGFAIRVLNGTPSHDYGQSEMFVSANAGIGADVLYLDKIGIMHDEAIGEYVGWVEDEYRVCARDTEAEFKRLLVETGIKKVGIMAMHGFFEFQIPIESVSSFSSRFWQSVTQRIIVCGHDHLEKNYGIIRIPGSLNRLSMNEEGDKGLTVVDMTPETTKKYFHVNEGACLQLTVPAMDDYQEQYKASLEAINRANTHPARIYCRVRILCKHDSPIFDDAKKWAKEFPFYITAEKEPNPKKKKQIREAFAKTVSLENITPDNIEMMILSQEPMTKVDSTTARKLIAEIK